MRALLFLPIWTLTACVQTETPAPALNPDSCQAGQFRGLVGQPRAVLDKMTLPSSARVIGPGDAVTADFRPDRLNFEISDKAVIAKIGCY